MSNIKKYRDNRQKYIYLFNILYKYKACALEYMNK